MSWAPRCVQAVSTCLVCTEGYDANWRRPKLLRCGHTFCLSCLSEIARLSGQRRPSMTPGPRSGALSCPKCREVTPLPEPHHAATHLVDNFAIVEFITGDDDAAEPEDRCARHQDEREKYFCMSCYRLLCPCCAFEHASQTPSHSVQDVESAAGHFRLRLRAALGYCRERQELLDRMLRDSAEERRRIRALCLSLEHLTGGVRDAELLSQRHTLMGLQDPEPHPEPSSHKTPKPSSPPQLSL
ncbi:hypothetical protein AALO_G00249290 [Alosa alosa]|uniref:Uncharacterized protein n=1 Tax=Alosa alosa TaxID=278164 RepID=A0AAV6FT72_9TELE|nr:E3 ubiquitin-protein ligase TRIM32-like [Alosa alosa]KAG5266053.1 hypothetical protein AALO_G00249290 [Alosa alosa]